MAIEIINFTLMLERPSQIVRSNSVNSEISKVRSRR